MHFDNIFPEFPNFIADNESTPEQGIAEVCEEQEQQIITQSKYYKANFKP